MKSFLNLMKIVTCVSFVALFSCKSKFEISTDGGDGNKSAPAVDSTQGAAKLVAQDCIDPDLSDLKTGVSIMLCDGTIASGSYTPDFPDVGNVLTTDTVNGVAGTYTPDFPATGNVLETDTVNSSAGTMSDFSGAWSLTNVWPGAGYFDTQPGFSLSKVCDDTNLFGSLGTADCSGGSFQSDMGSFVHRNSSAPQISVADEIALGAATAPPAGYYEVPRVGDTGVSAGDDYGHPDSASVDQVVRNSDAEWNAGTDRLVCGKSGVSVAAKITDCDTRHAADRPDFDTISGDARLMWDGALQGNASEGSWTLVTVYHPSFADGVTCNAACREVWRDDRTGMIWGDKIGGTATASLAGEFSWCVASGNTEAVGGGNTKECSPGNDAGYNEWTDGSTYNGVSLCTEVAGMLTPDGTGATDTGGPADDWPLAANTEVIDAKGGMDLSSTPAVRWRLPSVHDQAQSLIVNGGYYVLPNIRANSPSFWSSSVRADARFGAWLFSGNIGDIYVNNRDSDCAVRCVGR